MKLKFKMYLRRDPLFYTVKGLIKTQLKSYVDILMGN